MRRSTRREYDVEHGRGKTVLSLLGAAFVAAALGQAALRQLNLLSLSLAAFLACLALAAGANRTSAGAAPDAPRPALSWRPPRPWIAWLGAIAAVLCATAVTGDAPPMLQLGLWGLSIGGWVLAWVRTDRTPSADAAHSHASRIEGTDRLLLSTTFLIALLARTIHLEHIPGGLYGDEAVLGLRVRDIIAGEGYEPFGPGIAGTPATWVWVQAAASALFDSTLVVLRATSAVGASVSVVPVYLLLRPELGRTGATAGALLLAVSPMHVHASRIAVLEAWILTVFPCAVVCLYRALEKGRAMSWVGVGLFVGFGTLLGSKAVLLPPLLAGITLVWMVARRRLVSPLGIALSIVSALIVVLPLLVGMSSSEIWYALFGHSMRWLEGANVVAWPDRVALVARIFLDATERSPFSPWPNADFVRPVESVLFLVGLGLCLGRPSGGLEATLLGWLAAGLALALVDPVPNQLYHLVDVLPLPSIFGGVALAALTGATRRARWPSPVRTALLASALTAAVVTSVRGYYVSGLGRWQGASVAAMGRALGEFGPGRRVVVVSRPMSWDLISAWKYQAPGIYAHERWTKPPTDGRWFTPDGRDVVFIVDGQRAGMLPLIRKHYPGGMLREYTGFSGTLFALAYVLPASLADR